ncbi:DUF6557 family protein [[Clostridium] innocuum]|uniref:DUF6557 family protein n=1 Tax=Clostridium innocuum TaxID=1522 RepID=UPI000D6C3BC2|nr:DUF6557 family protein [[Clostridium] innocuum]MCR0316622.1 hypothetical protein [[Clostridium] innocuum]MCR0371755.1 hypothetical protein [[Clostridium] innocuum]MCR0561283.1 hypothetical protein [[Clostridium] innocuum]MCR0604394.1 hypothetical protein [[Clostridium] innocuum]PWJ09999.1 hypothetical protein ATF84_1245 [[Clostridium] innocuum]
MKVIDLLKGDLDIRKVTTVFIKQVGRPLNTEKVINMLGCLIDELKRLGIDDSINANLYIHENKCELDDEGIFEVFAMFDKNEDHYAIEFMDWKQLLNFSISSKSLKIYGKDTCIAIILYSMTEYGFTYNDARKNQKNMEDKIVKSLEEIESGKTYTLDEVREHFGLEKPSPEEQRTREKEREEIMEFNQEKMNEVL